MATLKWDSTGTVTTLITSAADLADGVTLLSSAYDNTPGGANDYLWADFELNLVNGVGVALTVQQPVELYILPAIDGTNYMDPASAGTLTDILVPTGMYRAAFSVRAEGTASTAQRLGVMDVPIPPLSFKVLIRNKTGQALKDGASHFTVKMTPKRLQSV